MRAKNCAAYLRLHDGERTAVLLTDGECLTQYGIPDSTMVISTVAEAGQRPTDLLLKSRARRRLVDWARSGSVNGKRLERTVRRLGWRLRHIDRAAAFVDARRRATSGTAPRLSAELEKLHAGEPITKLVAFDLFDLPVMRDFADSRDIPVIVR